jgi:hypothetical protein
LPEVPIKATVARSQETEITLTKSAPSLANRRYLTDWPLHDPPGRPFGDIILLRLVTAPPPLDLGAGFLTSNSHYVNNNTIPDGTPVVEGATFTKQ